MLGQLEEHVSPIVEIDDMKILTSSTVYQENPMRESDAYVYHSAVLKREFRLMQPIMTKYSSLSPYSAVIVLDPRPYVSPITCQVIQHNGKWLYTIRDQTYTYSRQVPIREVVLRHYPAGCIEYDGAVYRYYGPNAVKMYSYYDFEYNSVDLVPLFRELVEIVKATYDPHELVWIYKPSKAPRSFPIFVPRERSNAMYWWEGNLLDKFGARIYPPVRLGDAGWYRGSQPVFVREFSVVEVKDGPIQYDDRYFLPLYYCSFNLIKWRAYLRRYDYLHYYASNGYRIAQEAYFPDDKVY